MDLSQVRSVILVLQTLEEEGGTSTARDLCSHAGVSRKCVDRGLRVLIRNDLVQRGKRRFGRPCVLALTEKGAKAARVAGSLMLLLSNEEAKANLEEWMGVDNR